MTRKSKQPGGHNPLTHYERSKKFQSSQYGTTTARLGTDSQGRFGDCCLGLVPATEDPVATPSGHIYNRQAIVEYLLTKTLELKEQRAVYDAKIADALKKEELQKQGEQTLVEKRFIQEQQQSSAAASSSASHTEAFQKTLKRKLHVESTQEGRRTLQRTSYWLADVQPQQQVSSSALQPPPERPQSPMSGRPLKRKDLIPLVLQRSDDHDQKVLCCVSHKTITTQPVICITKTGHVMIKDVFEKYVQPNKVCPITGKPFQDKHILELQKGRSGFASSGPVQAKQYRPTMT